MKERIDIDTLLINTSNHTLSFTDAADEVIRKVSNMDLFYFMFLFDPFPRNMNSRKVNSEYTELLHHFDRDNLSPDVTVGEICDAIVMKYEESNGAPNAELNEIINEFLYPFYVLALRKAQR